MAILKPLVLKNGRIERLQDGDSLDTSADRLQRTFTSATSICMAVYVDGPGSVEKAQANVIGTVDVLGLAAETVGAASSGGVVTNGQVTATTGQWDNVTGQSGGLTTGSLYFLSAADAGEILVEGSQPNATGEFVKRIGQALSTTEMEVRIFQDIKL
jgi:hypothetical protein